MQRNYETLYKMRLYFVFLMFAWFIFLF